MNQLKAKNPTMARQIQEMINNGGNPYNLLKQTIGNYDENTRNRFYSQAEQVGFPKEYLQQIKEQLYR